MDLTKVRIREHFGIVTNDTSTVQFSFLVSPPKNRAGAEKESYIALDHPVFGDACPVLAVVREIKSYEEVAGSTLSERIGKMLAIAETVGYVDIRNDVRPMRKLLVPPNPGSRVYMPYSEFLEDTFSRSADGRAFKQALNLGKIQSVATSLKENVKAIRFYFDAEDLTNRHSLIAAMDGAGKTHVSSVIIEELANKTTHPIIIFDPYNEYITVGAAAKNLESLLENGEPVSKQYPFSFPVSILTTNPEKITKKLEKNGIAPLENRKISVKNIPGQWSSSPNDKAERETKENLIKSIETNKVTIVNPEGFGLEERNNLFRYCLEVLWKGRLEGSVDPIFVIIEDSENFKGELLERIASEGGKIGIFLCLLSKHPTELGGRILSQMGNQLLGRTTDKDDLEYLKNMVTETSGLLPQLTVGEWIINGITSRGPTRVFVRERHSISNQFAQA